MAANGFLTEINAHDVLANRPAAATANEGYSYHASDNGITYRSNGVSWDQVAIDTSAHAAIDHTGIPGVGAGGGGDGFGPFYDPDRPPAASNAATDEFDDDALHADWTWTTAPAGTVSESAFTGHLHIDGGTDAAGVVRILRRPYAPGATAFTVVGKMSVALENGNFVGGIGICILDSSDNELWAVSLASDGTTTASDSSRILATAGGMTAAVGDRLNSGWIYLMIQRSAANVYKGFWSGNGLTWQYLGTSTVATAVAKVGIRWFADTDSNEPQGAIDFLRVFDSQTKVIGADAA